MGGNAVRGWKCYGLCLAVWGDRDGASFVPMEGRGRRGQIFVGLGDGVR